MEELKQVLNQIGVGAAAIPFVLLAAAILVFFAKRAVERRSSEKAKRLDTLQRYAAAQEKAMLEAYRMLYEQVDLAALTDKEFVRLVCAGDDLIMAPFTEYRSYLDDDVKGRVYELHSILAQFRPDPVLPLWLTSASKRNLLAHKRQFLTDIENLCGLLRQRLKR